MRLNDIADRLIAVAQQGDSQYLEMGRLWNEAKAVSDFDSELFMSLLYERGFDKSKATLSKWGLIQEFWVVRAGVSPKDLVGKQAEKLYILAEYIQNKAQARGDTLRQMALEWMERVWGGERPLTDREVRDLLYNEPGGDPSEIISIRRSISERIVAIADAIARYTGQRRPSRNQIIERALDSVPTDPTDLVLWWARIHGEEPYESEETED